MWPATGRRECILVVDARIGDANYDLAGRQSSRLRRSGAADAAVALMIRQALKVAFIRAGPLLAHSAKNVLNAAAADEIILDHERRSTSCTVATQIDALTRPQPRRARAVSHDAERGARAAVGPGPRRSCPHRPAYRFRAARLSERTGGAIRRLAGGRDSAGHRSVAAHQAGPARARGVEPAATTQFRILGRRDRCRPALYQPCLRLCRILSQACRRRERYRSGAALPAADWSARSPACRQQGRSRRTRLGA